MGYYKDLAIKNHNDRVPQASLADLALKLRDAAGKLATTSAPSWIVKIVRAGSNEFAGQAVIVTLVTEEDEHGAFRFESIPMDAGTLLALGAAIEGALAALRLDSDDGIDAESF